MNGKSVPDHLLIPTNDDDTTLLPTTPLSTTPIDDENENVRLQLNRVYTLTYDFLFKSRTEFSESKPSRNTTKSNDRQRKFH